jgi:RHS repeat-associated protein
VTTYNYPGTSNKLSSLSGHVTQTESYDTSGNQTGDGTNAWAYNARGRMSTVTASSVTTTYGINGLGQRVTKSGAGFGGGGTNEYIYDDESGHLLGEYNSTGQRMEETIWLGDTPVAVWTGTGTPVVYALSADWQNAPHIIANTSGTHAWTWDRLGFGDNAPNQNPAGLGTFVYNPRFPGQLADTESGLSYNMARDYNPAFGRYIESDPIGLAGGVSTYGYAGGTPLSSIDPSGLSKLELRGRPIPQTADTADHMYIIVTDDCGGGLNFGSAGTQTITRAGPTNKSASASSGSLGSANGSTPSNGWGLLHAQQNLYGPGSLDYTTSPDFSIQIASDTLPASYWNDKLLTYVNLVNAAQIPYDPASTNSNSFATGAIQWLGFNTVAFPLAPGSGNPIHVSP